MLAYEKASTPQQEDVIFRQPIPVDKTWCGIVIDNLVILHQHCENGPIDNPDKLRARGHRTMHESFNIYAREHLPDKK